MALDAVRERWRYLYQEYLPVLAAARDPAQKHWPVHLDHCFARIVLDNAVGIDKPWTDAVKSPAIQNMTVEQLRVAVKLAEDIANGEVDLVALDERSLQLRGKAGKKRKVEANGSGSPTKKQRKPDVTLSSYFLPSPASPPKHKQESVNPTTPPETSLPPGDASKELKRIKDSNITAFRKQTLSLLCQIPPGRYSTYGTMADWISENSHKTCARAVGNAMRNNPFAPEVPCHRVLAGDRTLGGFKGSWGEEGKYAKQKHDLLHEEGVRFDSGGKAKGLPFRDFVAI